MKAGIRWGMVIDLRKCFGCGACVVACAEANQITPNLWRRVFDCGVGRPPERQRLYLPLSCMHCNEPPCEKVCPTSATFKRADGIVDIDSAKCIGCGYCIVACPYFARAIIFLNEYNLENRLMAAASKSGATPTNYIGTSTKCNFCRARIDVGLEMGLEPGKDPDASPACVVNCTAEALYFGDLNDPKSHVAQLVRENHTVCLQEALNTQPSIHYIVDPENLNNRLY